MLARRKWLFILPNAFTLGSLFCGFYSMTLAAGSPAPGRLYGASIAILFGMLFDGCDGRVARLTRTQSDFGMYLDSLADLVTFGAAPAMLLWKWALQPLEFGGLVIAFAFAGCGALRLARFNVLEARGNKGSSAYFVGLPIPLAAGVVVALVIAHARGPGSGSPVPPLPVAAITLLLSYLMVSTVRYRTFKTVRRSRRNALLLLLMATSAVALTVQLRASVTLLAFTSLYVVTGLVEQVVFLSRRRAERLAARAATVDGRMALIEEEDESDEDDDEEDPG